MEQHSKVDGFLDLIDSVIKLGWALFQLCLLAIVGWVLWAMFF